MDYYLVRVKNVLKFLKGILRWSVVAGAIGVLCGLLGALFSRAVGIGDSLLQEHMWLLFGLPILGLAIVFLYRILCTRGLNTDSIIRSADEGVIIKPLLIPAIFIATFLTHLGGGSSGREGAAFQMGGTIGGQVAKFLGLNKQECRVAIMSGMAAFFAAIFGLPVTAALFVTMVINVGSFWHGAIFPELVASLIAAGIARKLGVVSLKIPITAPDFELIMFIKVAILAALGALVSTFFCDFLHETEKRMEGWFKNEYIRIMIGGCVTAGIMLLLGTTSYSGAGGNLISLAIADGKVNWYDFLLKIFLTAVTLGAGYKGGEVLPSLAIGATFGCLLSPVLGIPVAFGAAVGMISVFGGCSNSLIAPIFMAVEMFGASGIDFYALACIIAYMMSGYAGFYYNQKIIYSKTKPQQINLHANEQHEE